MPKPAFRAGTIHARVPASSANLGPGFDTLGLALALHDDVVARIGDDGLVLDIAGEGADDVPHDDSHLVVRSMRAVFEQFGGQPRGIELVCANRIPHGRGLGSSAAAVVAGVLIGRALVVGGDTNLPDDEVLALAAELEGHPDNVAACLLGGLTVAWTGDDGRVEAARLGVDPAISPVVLIPPTAKPAACCPSRCRTPTPRSTRPDRPCSWRRSAGARTRCWRLPTTGCTSRTGPTRCPKVQRWWASCAPPGCPRSSPAPGRACSSWLVVRPRRRRPRPTDRTAGGSSRSPSTSSAPTSCAENALM